MRLRATAAFALLLLAGAGSAPIATDDLARDQLARLVRRVSAIRAVLPRETCDLYALAGSARTDAELCAWVREHVGLQPYAGFQRGAAGTLASGSGNAADRALLLATLLRTRGVDAQLVRGTAQPVTTVQPARLPTVAPNDALVVALAKAAGVDPSRLRSAPTEAAVLSAGLQTRLERRVRRDRAALLGVLEGEVPPPTGVRGPVSTEHWWVRTPDGDLDPTLDAGAASGGTVVAIEKLPADACQTLRVTCKLRVEGAAEDTPLLDVTLRTAEVFGDALAFGVMPVDGTAKVAALQDPTAATVMAALATTKAFQPQVSTPQRTHSGRVFDLSGKVMPVEDGRVAAAKEIGGKVGDLFGGISGEAEEKKPPAVIAACWFELELGVPGAEPARVRRDLLRPKVHGAQRVFDLLTMRQVLVAAEGFGDDWLTDQFLTCVQGTAELARIQLRGEPTRLSDWRQAPRFPVELHGFVAARKAALGRLQGEFAGASLLYARPLVVAQLTRFLDDVAPRMETGIDILHNDVVDLGPAAKTWSASLPLAVGVLDTALEHEVRERGAKAVNTSALYERAALLDGAMRLATPDDLPPPAAAELTAGTVACVTFQSSPATWYRVDRRSGSALGLVAFGGGQATSEYGVVAEMMVQLQEAICFFRDLMVCITVAVLSPLAGEEGGKNVFQNCVWNLVCGKIIDYFTSFVEITPTWHNVLARKAVSETWNSICEELAKKMGMGKKGG